RGGSQARVAVRAVLLRGRAALGAELRARRDRAVAVGALERRRLVLVHRGLRGLGRRWRGGGPAGRLAVPLAGPPATRRRGGGGGGGGGVVRCLGRGLHHLACHAHAGREEHGSHALAALGHALARTLQGLGLGRLQEAAGQPAVRGVARQLLQPRIVVIVEV